MFARLKSILKRFFMIADTYLTLTAKNSALAYVAYE